MFIWLPEGSNVVLEESVNKRPINYSLYASIFLFILLHIRFNTSSHIYQLHQLQITQPYGVQEVKAEAGGRLWSTVETAAGGRVGQ